MEILASLISGLSGLKAGWAAFAVISPNATETAMAGKSLGLLAAWPGRVPSLSAYAYQRSVSLLLAFVGRLPMGETRRVEMWRGGGRSNISVSAPFVWRCLTGSAVAPFPHPAHRTGQADLPHPALGQDVTPSPTTGRAQAGSGVRARGARKDARVDKLRPFVARLCA